MISEVDRIFNSVILLIPKHHHLFKLFILFIQIIVSDDFFGRPNALQLLILLDHLGRYLFILLFSLMRYLWCRCNYGHLLRLQVDDELQPTHVCLVIMQSHMLLQVVRVEILEDKDRVADKFFV